MICKPKMKGGLGTVDFLKKNDALLIKFPHRSYNKDMDVPWVKLVWESYYNNDVPRAAKSCGSYWWEDISKLVDNYKSVAKTSMKSGETILL
jgi:hypothetical protein